MQLAQYHYTDFHTVVIPDRCRDLRVHLTGDDEGPELMVFWSDEKSAINDSLYHADRGYADRGVCVEVRQPRISKSQGGHKVQHPEGPQVNAE